MLKNDIDYNKASEKIANIILLKNNSIKLSEIKALPFISDIDDVYLIISKLHEKYSLQEENIYLKENDLLSYDTVFKLVV